MRENIKPVLDQVKAQVKETLANKEQIRDTFKTNFFKTKSLVESQALELLKQTKESKVVHEYLIPILESEKTENAMTALNEKLGHLPFMTKINEYRKSIIDLKAKDEAAGENSSDVQSAEISTEEEELSEEKVAEVKAPRKRKKK